MDAQNTDKKKITLQEQREYIQDSMKIALAVNNMAEYHRLNGHLIWIEEKIRKENK